MSAPILDCRSPEGETVGLIDAAIVTLRLVSRADLSSGPVREALADLLSDPEVAAVLRAGGGGQAPASR